MKKLMVFALLFAGTLNISFAQVKLSKEAPTYQKEATMKGNRMNKIKAAMETAGVPLNEKQVDGLISIYQTQSAEMKAIRANTELTEEAKKASGKELRAKTNEQIDALLSEEQLAVMDDMKKERREKVKSNRPKRGNADPSKMADHKLNKLSTTLDEANLSLSEEQSAQLKALFLEESTAMQAAKTQSRSEMGTNDIRKNIRMEYKEKIQSVLSTEQSEALKAVRKTTKRRL